MLPCVSLALRGEILLILGEIRVKHYLWPENYGQRFYFLTDSNSRCIGDLVESGLGLFVWLFGVASPSLKASFVLTAQLLPTLVLGIIFCGGMSIILSDFMMTTKTVRFEAPVSANQ